MTKDHNTEHTSQTELELGAGERPSQTRQLDDGNSDVFVDREPDGGIENDELVGSDYVEPMSLDLFEPDNELSPENKGMILNSISSIVRSSGVIGAIIEEYGYAPPWAESKIYVSKENLEGVAGYMQTEAEKRSKAPELRADLGAKSNASEAMNSLPESTQKTLKAKGKEHNEEYGDNPAKKLPQINYLAVCYHRGIGAYNENPSSVRPNVGSAQQWAMARVNGFLYALRNGKYKRSPYDTDLLPPDHPDAKAESSLSFSVRHLIDFYKGLERAPKDEGWGWTEKEAEKVLGDPPDMDRYRRAFLFVNKGQTRDADGYKLPIAKMIGDELKIVFRGVVASGTALRGDQSKAGFSSGAYNLDGATERDKRELYEVIKSLYSSFGETAPEAPWEEDQDQQAQRQFDHSSQLDELDLFMLEAQIGQAESDRVLLAVGDEDPTNFPKAGDDKKVSLRNSEYKLFDLSFAKRIKEDHPEIWDLGGNVLGNKQFNRLAPIVERGGSIETRTEEEAVRLREAWSARHFEDKRINGVIAQVKWLTIGSRGEKYMKDLIREEIKKREDRDRALDLIDRFQKRAEPVTSCPVPTENLELNKKNKMEAKELYDYGEAQGADKCGNCAFYDQREGVLSCIKQGLKAQGIMLTPEELSERGYCRALDFTCGSGAWCKAWTEGGPILDGGREDGAGTAQADKEPHSKLSKGEPMNKPKHTEARAFSVSSMKRSEDGGNTYSLSGAQEARLGLDQIQIRAVYEDGAEATTPEERARRGRPPSYYMIEGVASSTSVDHYGTEMTYTALLSMQEQFMGGVPILPRHQSILSEGMAEWDEVIGRSEDAEIRMMNPDQMKNAYDYGERQYVLTVKSKLYGDDPKARELVRRLDRGEPIGQSIGGWFNKMEVVENSEGEIVRVMVEELSLDHLAITRAPANPDSYGLASIRSLASQPVESFRARLEDPKDKAYQAISKVPEDMKRHISEVIDDGETILIRFMKTMPMEDDDMSEDMTEETKTETLEARSEISETTEAEESTEKIEVAQNTDELIEEAGDKEERSEKTPVMTSETEQPAPELRSQTEVLEPAQASEDNTKQNIDSKNLDNCVMIENDNGNGLSDRSIENANNNQTQPVQTDEELLMNEENMNKIADLLRSSLAPLADRLEKLEARTVQPEPAKAETVEAPVVRAVETNKEELATIDALRSELAQTRTMLDKVMSEPVRQGRHQTTHIRGVGATGAYSELVTRAKAEGAVALATIVEQNIEAIAGEKSDNVSARSQHDLIDLLAKGLRSAELDGLLGTKQVTNWN